jgi:hypothetical protein
MSYESRLKALTDQEREVLEEALNKAESIPYSELEKHLKGKVVYCLFDYEVKDIGQIIANCHYDGHTSSIRVGVTLTKPGILSFMFPAGMDTIISKPKP